MKTRIELGKRVDVRPRDLATALRRARVEDTPLYIRGRADDDGGGLTLHLVAGRDATVTLDGHNAIAEIDGALTLSSAARRIEKLGAVFPLARPLPALSLAAACAALPFFVDAFVQQATLLTFDGDPCDTPRAPRAAAGPSLLGALCSRPPLALCVRARVRVQLASHAVVRKEEHASTRAAAERIRALLDDGRAFSVDASGACLLVLAGTYPKTNVPQPASGSAGSAGSPASAFTHEGRGRRASFARAVSLVPGDVDAIAAALDAGDRVVAAPFIGRAAALRHGFEEIRVHEVRKATAQLASALAAAAVAAAPSSAKGSAT